MNRRVYIAFCVVFAAALFITAFNVPTNKEPCARVPRE